jgi:hypothetical protein
MSTPRSGRSGRESPNQVREEDSFIFPVVGKSFDDSTPDTALPAVSSSPPPSSEFSVHSTDLSASDSSLASSQHTGVRTPKGHFKPPPKPSGLSLLLARSQEGDDTAQPILPPVSGTSSLQPVSSHAAVIEEEPFDLDEAIMEHTPIPTNVLGQVPRHHSPPLPKAIHWEDQPRRPPNNESVSELTETTPLLGSLVDYRHPSYFHNIHEQKLERGRWILQRAADHLRELATIESLRNTLVVSVKSLPAVILGSLLNILDGVSCQ